MLSNTHEQHEHYNLQMLGYYGGVGTTDLGIVLDLNFDLGLGYWIKVVQNGYYIDHNPKAYAQLGGTQRIHFGLVFFQFILEFTTNLLYIDFFDYHFYHNINTWDSACHKLDYKIDSINFYG